MLIPLRCRRWKTDFPTGMALTRAVKDLHCPFFHYELVKRAVTLSLDKIRPGVGLLTHWMALQIFCTDCLIGQFRSLWNTKAKLSLELFLTRAKTSSLLLKKEKALG